MATEPLSIPELADAVRAELVDMLEATIEASRSGSGTFGYSGRKCLEHGKRISKLLDLIKEEAER